MATHYTCDRCSKPVESQGANINVKVSLEDWVGMVRGKTTVIVGGAIRGPFYGPECDTGKPDLCRACIAEALRAAAVLIEAVQ